MSGNHRKLLTGYIRAEQLARELNISTRTLARWHVAGVGPPRVVVGRLVLYSRAGVERWLVSGEQQGKAKSLALL